jgi:hypothetical protein
MIMEITPVVVTEQEVRGRGNTIFGPPRDAQNCYTTGAPPKNKILKSTGPFCPPPIGKTSLNARDL